MNIEDINIFLTINQCQNISKAANLLFMSQSTLSYRLSVMEADLGVQLFVREKGHGRLSLTQKGERFLLVAERMQNTWDEALELRNEKERLRLSVMGVDSVNEYFLVGFYQTFVREHPNIELSVFNQYTNEILGSVEQRNCDVGISNAHFNYDSIRSEVIFKEEYVCLMRGRTDEKKEEIGTLNIQELNPMAEVYQEFDFNLKQWRKMCGLEHQPKFRTETVSMNVHLMDTLGDWSIMPYTVAQHFNGIGPFRIYRLIQPPLPRSVYVTTNIKKDDSEVLLFKEKLIEYAKNNFVADLVYA